MSNNGRQKTRVRSASRLRVMLVTGSYPPMRCGVGDYSASLARALVRSGCAEVDVLTSSAAAAAHADRSASLRVHALMPSWSWVAARTAIRFARERRPDVVHIQFPTQGYGRSRMPWALPWLLRLGGHSVVQTWHEFLPCPTHSLSLLQLSGGGRVIVVRPGYVDALSPVYRRLLKRRSITYIPSASSIPTSVLDDEGRNRLRESLAPAGERLLVYFGFANPNKQVELLFDIADPRRDRLVLACELDPTDRYHAAVLDRAQSTDWKGRVLVTGRIDAERAADLMAAADAVVLPFRDGGGDWNSSLLAARLQGTFVVTTSLNRHGYDDIDHSAYCAPTDVAGMRVALDTYAGARRPVGSADRSTDKAWDRIAAAHLDVYSRAGVIA